MSQLYDDYLKEHVTNVGKAWVWMWDNLPVSPVYGMEIENLVRMHDMSKTKRDEYRAYDDYFTAVTVPPAWCETFIRLGSSIFTAIPITGSTGC